MSDARWRVERLLQEGDDRQTQRGWEIRRDATFIDLRDNYAECSHRILIRITDVPLLIADLQTIAGLGSAEGVAPQVPHEFREAI